MPTKAMPAFRKTAETFSSGARTLPQRYLISPDIFAKEQGRIFSTQWLCVGRQSQLGKPGDFFLQNVAGESLIILRDQEGQVRGFYNVCRHRGTRICKERSGQLRETLQCPYHAWTYGLDGKLLGAPHMESVKGFDKAQHSLRPVNLALWEGFIFVNLAESPAPMEIVFAPLKGKFTHCKSMSMHETPPTKGGVSLEVRSNVVHAGRRPTLRRLTENRETAPYAWVNPDQDHKATLSEIGVLKHCLSTA